MRLTERDFWDSKHGPVSATAQATSAVRRRVKAIVWRLAGSRVQRFSRNYADYLQWDVVFESLLPRSTETTILEVGSAPGHNLIRFHERFGYKPYGVEFSETGVSVNQELFARHGLDQRNVIHADFLSEDFQKTYRGFFDVVYSAGFIEHFTDARSVIEKHIDLLRPGGHLIVSIPNLRGLNYLLTALFRRELLAMHNLGIMNKARFEALFDRSRVDAQFSSYIGTFSFWIIGSRPGSPLRFLWRLCDRLQLLLNILFRAAFNDKGLESKWFSPYLLFIGVRR